MTPTQRLLFSWILGSFLPLAGAQPLPPSSNWREVALPGEDFLMRSIPALVRGVQDANARYFGGQILRTFHPYAKAAYRAEFRVRDQLPPEARHGIFQPGARYPARIRFSRGLGVFRSDKVPDIWGVAVKLLEVPGEPLLEDPHHGVVQDFTALNSVTFPAPNAASVPKILEAAADYAQIWWKGPKSIRIRDYPRGAQIFSKILAHRVRSLALETYHSGIPLRVGPFAAKFCFRPKQASPPQRERSRDFLAEELAQRLNQGGVQFEFCLQFFVDEDRTPIEENMKVWKPRHSAWIPVADLVLVPDAPEESRAEVQEEIDQLYFHPWQGIQAHRPLGSVARARRWAYSASQAYRGRPSPDPMIPPDL